MQGLSGFLDKLQVDTSNIIKLGLENTKIAADLLNLKKPAPYIVMVAGTNGKGSVITLLESLLVNLGFRTGCYTSPHLIKFNERIRINANPVNDTHILKAFNYVKNILDVYNKSHTNQISLTFFEFITIGAWQLFQESNLDILLLEVGLGGRLDAVNVIEKDLAIITSVDFDHQNILGNTLEEIGYQKAGIIVANKPVILGDKNMPRTVTTEANGKNAKIFHYEVDYFLKETSSYYIFTQKFENTVSELKLEKRSYPNIRLNNIATSLKALEIISNDSLIRTKGYFNQDQKSYLAIINKTVKNFNLLGRCTWLDTNRTILIDVAHNLQSVANLNNYLMSLIGHSIQQNSYNSYANCQSYQGYQVVAIFGMLKDKDIESCIKVIEPRINQWFIASVKEHRGADANDLSNLLININSQVKYNNYDDLQQAFVEAYRFLGQSDNKKSILVVFGSFHVVGPFYLFYKNKSKSIGYGH